MPSALVRRGLLVVLLCLPASLPGQGKEGPVTIEPPPSYRPGQGTRPDIEAAVKQILDQTNAFRKEEGRKPVEVNKELTATARSFARFMAEHDKYGHTADGTQPADRAKKAGYEYCIVLENIAYQYSSAGFRAEELAGGFFQGWKKSPGHRKNMLDPDVTETGVAVDFSPKTGHFYAVQMFGRPQSQRIEFKIANAAGEVISYTLGDRKFDLPAGFTRTHQECRPPTLTLGEEKVQPTNGASYRVEKGAGRSVTLKAQ